MWLTLRPIWCARPAEHCGCYVSDDGLSSSNELTYGGCVQMVRRRINAKTEAGKPSKHQRGVSREKTIRKKTRKNKQLAKLLFLSRMNLIQNSRLR